jgi:hypothetical protein
MSLIEAAREREREGKGGNSGNGRNSGNSAPPAIEGSAR